MSLGFVKRLKKRKGIGFGSLFGIGTVCVILAAALGLLGASYASWSQVFRLFGSINTGDISVVVRDVYLESSDSCESFSLTRDMEGGVVGQVNIDAVTGTSPFSATLVFTVENNGTIPVACEGIDTGAQDDLEVRLVDAPGRIGPGETAPVKVRITKGYCSNFEFEAFLRVVQATG